MEITLSVPTLAGAQEQSRLFAMDQAVRANGELANRYNSNFNAWKTMVDAGTVPNTNPPKPPNGWDAVKQADGWWYEMPGSDQVCAARTDIPADRSTPAPVPNRKGDNARNVAPGDKTPLGVRITAPDGSEWEKQSSETPFGVAVFWVRVG